MKNLRHLLSRTGLLSEQKRRRSDKPRQGDRAQRRLSSETLEKRELLAGDFAPQHNYWNAFDVNDDGQISARDALAIINQLGRQSSGEAELAPVGEDDGPRMFYDVNKDLRVSASDALTVINAIGRGEEVGELIEVMLNARDANDALIAPGVDGAVQVDVGQTFFLEVSYDDLRTFGNRLGAVQIFGDIEFFDAEGNLVTDAVSPVLNEAQRLVISEDIQTVGSTGVTFTIATTPPGVTGGSLTYVSDIDDFANDTTGEVTNALLAFGYTDDQFEISSVSFDNDDLGFDVFFGASEFANIDLPRITLDVNESNPATTIATSTQEFSPFLADGVTPNGAAVPFNINAFSRTFNDNEPYYSSLNRGNFGTFTQGAETTFGFNDVGGFASEIPFEGGGIPDVTDDGRFIEPFDAFSLPVFINRPIQGLRLQLTPAEDDEAILLYGRNDRLPQDLILLENVDSNNNGTAQLVINAGTVVVAPGTLAFSQAAVNVNEDAGTVTFTVNRTGGSDGAVAVNFATSNGTATAGSDYTAATGTLNFGDGVTSQTITVNITDDMADEPNETFTVTLSGATGGAALGTIASATATIVDNDDPVANPGTFSLSPSPTTSVNEDGGSVIFTVNRTGGSDGSVTVNFATTNGTAVAGSDFTATNGTLTFADGQTSQTVTVNITNDTDVESNETFLMQIGTPTGGAVLGTATQTAVTIVDNDSPVAVPGTFTIAPPTLNVNEGAGTATFTVNRSGGSDGAVTVDFATANGTATAGSDYTARTGTLNFAAGQTSQTITVNITNDTADEPNETFTVTLSNATGGATLGTVVTSTATILDNDDPVMVNPGTLSISPLTLNVNEGAGAAVFTVNRTSGSDGVVTVDFATANGTSNFNQDYERTTGTLTFADGQTSQTISVPIINDTVDEANETFTLTLTNATGGATIGSALSTATIIDNDDPVVVNNPPVVSGPIAQTFAETASATTVSLLTGASDPDGDTLSISTPTITGNAAGVTVSGTNVNINPAAYASLLSGETATATLAFNVTDGRGGSTPQTATFTFTGVSTPPVANDDSATVIAGGTVRIAVLGNDNAGGGEMETLTVTTASSAQGATLVNADNTISFTPNAGLTGPATISYTIRDAAGLTASANVSVDVQSFMPTSITGAVYIDNITNLQEFIRGAAPVRNGIRDSNDQGFGGILVRLSDSTGAVVASVRSGLDGNFQFDGVSPGTYTVSYDLPDTVVASGPTSSTVVVDGTGGFVPAGGGMSLLGTQGAAIETVDLIASSYLRTNQNIAAISDEGREGGLVSLGADGLQEFFIAGAGYEDVTSAEFVLSDDGDAALLVVVEEGATAPTYLRMSSDQFVITPDGRGVQFFGGMEDLDMIQTNESAVSSEFSNFQAAVDRALADM